MKTIALALLACLTVLSVPLSALPEAPSPAEPAASPVPDPGRIRVEVLSQLGKPITGARVRLFLVTDPGEDDPCSCGSWEEIVPAEAVPGVFEEVVAPGTYRVEATGDEWIGAMEEGVEINSGELRQLKFNLEPGSVISGMVSDEAGNPLADVEVSYRAAGFGSHKYFHSRIDRVASDSSGRFAFRSLSPGVYDLEFNREGYREAEVDDAATGTTDLEVEMKPGFVILVRLEGDLEELESPVRIQLKSGRWGTDSRTVDPGPENEFEVAGLERKLYSIRLQDKNYLSDWLREVEALPAEEAPPVTLAVFRGASLSGRVTEAGTGDSLSDVNLRLFPAGSGNSDYASSDEEGAFSFDGLKPGEYTLKARFWQDASSKCRLEKQVVIGPGRGVEGFDLELEAGRPVTFSGTVLDETGDLVGDARIEIYFRPAGGESYRHNFVPGLVTDGSGNFSHTLHLDSGGDIRIVARKEGYAPGDKKIELTADQTSVSGVTPILDHGCTLAVEIGGGVEGREAIPSAIVTLGNDWSEDRDISNYVDLKKLTDARGRCRFDNLAPGAYRIEVTKSGYVPAEEKVRLDETETAKTVDLLLERGRSIQVRVENEIGEPVVGAELSARERKRRFFMGGSTGQDQTNSSGVCLIRDLPSGPLSLRVQADGYVTVNRHRVEEDQDEITVVMKSAGSIRGRFLGDGGRPLADLNIITRKRTAGPLDFEPGFFNTEELGDGVFRVVRLAPGVYDLTIRSDGRAGRKIEAVEVEAGRETDLGEIVLGPGSGLKGRITVEDGSPLKGAWVRIETPEKRIGSIFAVSDMSASDGAFTIGGLNPGSFVLMVTAKNYRSERISGVTVGTGEVKELPDIRLARLTEAEKEQLERQSNVIPSLGVRIVKPEKDVEPADIPLLVIEEVLPGTAAQKSGLAIGDEIVKVNGYSPADDPMEFFQGLLAPSGTEIKITVRRAGDGREEELDLTVDQWSMEDLISRATQVD
ncbi:MAG: carboxypeptidase regulatory-like domain-containing protein [Candidatus Erginobacter occultus]|nr:carboxypeptidase regulatory-like domain-containing protein [Candidatus Erginobacter occultus]